MGNRVSSSLGHSLLQPTDRKKNPKCQDATATIGILSFETANVISRAIHLYKTLKDLEISNLQREILTAEGIRNLVSSDENYLLGLVLAEKVDDLNQIAGAVSRLGKRCSIPALQGFEHVYTDIVTGILDVKKLGVLSKDMDGLVKKMASYVKRTANLYNAIEVSDALDQQTTTTLRHHDKHKWRTKNVKRLKQISLWNKSYNKVVELLGRMVVLLYGRISLAFHDHLAQNDMKLSVRGTPSTVGGSALGVRYANIIIVTEKFLRHPHLVGEDARDDLYEMLPTSLKSSLRTHLKCNARSQAIYDATVCSYWKGTANRILEWVAPLAHDTMRWQNERGFEQYCQIGKRSTNTTLVQTLYYADREKTEAAMCKVLVALNYLCRYEQQQDALLDCVSSSFDIEDCIDREMQTKPSFFP